MNSKKVVKKLSKEEKIKKEQARQLRLDKKYQKEMEEDKKRKPISADIKVGDVLYDSNHEQKWVIIEKEGDNFIAKKPKGQKTIALEWNEQNWIQVDEDNQEGTDRWTEIQVECDFMY